MLNLISPRALLRFDMSIPARRPTPQINGDARKWSKRFAAPALCRLDGQTPFAQIYWSWNEEGLAIAVNVPERTKPFRCDPDRWWKGDGLRLCVDTRDTRDLRRATRFCHFYYVLPAGGGKKAQLPVIGLHRMSRAREMPGGVDPSCVRVAVERGRIGYVIETLLPPAALHGWSPAEQPRIGIFIKVRDTQFGDQNLTTADELGWNSDPSQWASARLEGAEVL